MSEERVGHTYNFLRSHKNVWVKARDKHAVVITHTFLDGYFTGNLSVTPELHDAFYDAIAKDYVRHNVPPINELRNGCIFAFFIDFDMLLREDWLHAVNAETLAPLVTRQVFRFYPQRVVGGALKGSVVLTTPDQRIDGESNGGATVKRGIHMHFPDTLMDTDQALTVRAAIVSMLHREFETFDIDWNKCYDAAPYINGGLRMIGAYKAPRCKVCNGKRKATADVADCDECFGTGRIALRSQVYRLFTALCVDGREDEEARRICEVNAAVLVRACSLRTTRTSTSEDWTCFAGCPPHNFALASGGAGTSNATAMIKRSFVEDVASRRVVKWPKEAVTDVRALDCIKKIVRTRFSAVYANVMVSQVNRNTRSGMLFVQLSGEGESYCLNLQDRHKSNRVFAVIEASGIAYMRCHCQCVNLRGRRQGYCRDFKSKPEVKLTTRDAATLFSTFRSSVQVAASKKAANKSPPATSASDYLLNVSKTLELANALHEK